MDARERILDAALRVFAESGTRGATTRRIAEEAGVNEVTLFRHFGSKERLLHEALRHVSARVPASGLPEEPADPEAELIRWAHGQLRHLNEARSLIRTSMGEFEEHSYVRSAACEAPRRVAEELNRYLHRLRDRGRIDPACDVHAASALLMGAIFSDAMGRDMMPERFPYSREEAAVKYVHLFLRAVGATLAVERPGEPGRQGAERGLAASDTHEPT